MPFDFLGGAVEQLTYLVRNHQLRRAEVGFMETTRSIADRVHFEALRKSRLTADQASQANTQFRRQGLGECRQQDSGIGMRAGKVDRRWSATTVLPVPAEPATRAGPR